jgi:hypothetical protein
MVFVRRGIQKNCWWLRRDARGVDDRESSLAVMIAIKNGAAVRPIEHQEQVIAEAV